MGTLHSPFSHEKVLDESRVGPDLAGHTDMLAALRQLSESPRLGGLAAGGPVHELAGCPQRPSGAVRPAGADSGEVGLYSGRKQPSVAAEITCV